MTGQAIVNAVKPSSPTQALQDESPRHGGRSLLVGTANSSLDNIAFYQKCGFRMYEIRRDYFAYIQPPVLEYGILLRDMLVFRYDPA
jgi:ribosomal protein S18 acetylase RimI-like enzyme